MYISLGEPYLALSTSHISGFEVGRGRDWWRHNVGNIKLMSFGMRFRFSKQTMQEYNQQYPCIVSNGLVLKKRPQVGHLDIR